MRKRNFAYFVDTTFWFLLSILPLIVFVIMLWHNGLNGITMTTAFNACGLDIITNNFIFDGLVSLFGVDGVFPLFNSPDLLIYLTYLIGITIAHLAVDVLLFIPRFAHKCMDTFGGDK